MSIQEVRMKYRRSGGHAVVMGGSMAGLLAARVLTDHFEKVTIIERDPLPNRAENRKGVPQGRHLHGLLNKGADILSRLFPDLIPALVSGGATTFDAAAEARWHHFGGYKVQFQSGITAIAQSRPFLEYEVRRRVLALHNLETLQECDVKGLVTSPDQRTVTGVKIQRRVEEAIEQTLPADLVVDATGRGSQSPKWLQGLGYPRPEETVVKVDVGYTTRNYRRKPGDLSGAKLLLVYPTPPVETRMGGMFPIEDDRWIVTLGGWVGDHAPAEEQGFLEFARSLPVLDLYNFIKQAEPLTDLVTLKYPANRRHRYEKMTRFPEGYIVLGDALCSFNPIYGQGMTASALEAVTLDTCLKEQQRQRDDLTDFPSRFFQKAAKVVDIPWSLAVGEDFRYPQVEGVKAPGTDLINWYVGKVHRVVMHDPLVYRAFLNLMNLTHPPTTMFNPRILLRVIKGSMFSRLKTKPLARRARQQV